MQLPDNQKIIIVTGATGFIGGAICYSLKKKGYFVIGVDLVNRKHIMPYIDMFFQRDFVDIPQLFSPVIHKCDAVIHCAGTSLVEPSFKYPLMYYENNVSKTIKLLGWCADQNKHFMFSSSASIYKSDSKNLTIKEHNEKEPISPYSKSKWMVEQVIEDFRKAYNLKATIFRYFNACGAIDDIHGQEPGATHIFPRLFECNGAFKLNGLDYNTRDKSCIRDYIHILDIADAHIKAVEKNCYGVYNLGSKHGYSNLEIIEAVGKPYDVVSRREGDIDYLVANNTAAYIDLEWEPTFTLTGIINSLTKWYTSETYLKKVKSNE